MVDAYEAPQMEIIEVAEDIITNSGAPDTDVDA